MAVALGVCALRPRFVLLCLGVVLAVATGVVRGVFDRTFCLRPRPRFGVGVTAIFLNCCVFLAFQHDYNR